MNKSLLLLISQLIQLAVAEVPNVVAIIKTLKDGTSNLETFLTEADTIELAELGKLEAKITPPTAS